MTRRNAWPRDLCLAVLAAGVAASAACAPRVPPAGPAPVPPSAVAGQGDASRAGRVLRVESGTSLILCSAPGLSVELRLDSMVATGTPIAMGTAEVAAGGSNSGAHPETDEAIYFLSAGGRAFVGSDTTEVAPGVMLWIPRGVSHGFLSAVDRPIRFVWVNYPQTLAQRFRERGVEPGTACPPLRSP